MLWVYDHYKKIFLQRGVRLQSSESDVYIRQILTTEVYPRAVRVKPLFIQQWLDVSCFWVEGWFKLTTIILYGTLAANRGH